MNLKFFLCDVVDFKYLLYADDMVFIVNSKYINMLIKCIYNLTE